MKYLCIAIILIFASACSTTKTPTSSSNKISTQKEEIGILLEQGKETYSINENDKSLHLSKTPFSLSFEVFPYNPDKEEWYSVKIASTVKADQLKYLEEGDLGANPLFSPGTGMATYAENPYPEMFVGDIGHHYIYYTNETDTRAKFISKNKNGKVRLKWDIRKINFEEKAYNIEQIPMDELFILIYIDDNLNNLVESGEHHILRLNFK